MSAKKEKPASNVADSILLLSVLALGLAIGAGLHSHNRLSSHSPSHPDDVVDPVHAVDSPAVAVAPAPAPAIVSLVTATSAKNTHPIPCITRHAQIAFDHNPGIDEHRQITHIPIKVFTKAECALIIETVMKQTLVAAMVQLEGANLTVESFLDDSRRTFGSGVDKNSPHLRFVYERVIDTVYAANKIYWRYNITRNPDSPLIEHMQFQIYNASNLGHYTWHQDQSVRGELATRKVSVTVQLSDPSTYEGGNLELKAGEQEMRMSREQGAAVIFPSYMVHRVTPVTTGIRASMAIWFHEPYPTEDLLVKTKSNYNQRHIPEGTKHEFEEQQEASWELWEQEEAAKEAAAAAAADLNAASAAAAR